MNPTKAVLMGVILPALFSLAIFAAAWFKSRKREDTQRHIWCGAVALGVGFCGAYFLLLGVPTLPPTEAAKWIPLIVLVTAVFGLVDGIYKLPYSLIWLLRLVVSLGFTWQLLGPMVKNHWTSADSSRWVGWISVVIVVIWGFLDETAWRVRGAALPIALTICSGALGVCLLWGGSALLFQIALILAAVMAGAILPGLWRHSLSLASGAIPIFVMTYYSLLVSGYFYAELPMLAAAALALAPAGTVLSMASVLRKNPKWETVVAVTGALVPAGVGLYLSYAAKLGSPGAYY